MDTGSIRDISIDYKIFVATNIVAKFIRSKRFKLPPQDVLVIHLRLGDCYTTDNRKFPTAKSMIPNKNKILDNINKYNGNKIIIVTAFNNHTNNPLEIISHNNQSQKFLDDLICSIPKKYTVSIRSSTNIDAHFIYLCAAKNLLLTSNSLFGQCAKKIGIILHKIAH